VSEAHVPGKSREEVPATGQHHIVVTQEEEFQVIGITEYNRHKEHDGAKYRQPQ
jgi:hypothetical protein